MENKFKIEDVVVKLKNGVGKYVIKEIHTDNYLVLDFNNFSTWIPSGDVEKIKMPIILMDTLFELDILETRDRKLKKIGL